MGGGRVSCKFSAVLRCGIERHKTHNYEYQFVIVKISNKLFNIRVLDDFINSPTHKQF